jgi:Ca2+-binding RTX toxin-like protein
MSDPTLLFNDAELALASYANLIDGDTLLQANRDALLAAGMSTSQITAFAARYPTVVMSFSDPSTGFQVTVFKDDLGDVKVAIRGVSGDDLAASIDIGGAGAAYNQIVAMWNWWARASSPSGEMVQQYRLVEVLNQSIPPGAVVLRATSPDTSYVLDVAPQVGSTGELVDALGNDLDGRVDLIGHSLGGHLAMAFSSLFAGQAGQVTAFNAPGFENSTVNQSFFAMLGGSIPTGSIPSGSILNVAADEALVGASPFNFIARMWSAPGTLENIAIEDQTGYDQVQPFLPALNHSMVALTDSLAVYKLLSDLCATTSPLTTTDYKFILNRAAIFGASYERIVDGLESLLGINDEFLPAGNEAFKREALYQAITALRADPNYQQRLGTLQIAATVDSAATLLTQMQTAGDEGLAYRFAVRELVPFVVFDPSAGGLYARFKGGPNAGPNAGELDLYDAVSNPQGLTQTYLDDRAAFLERKLHITALNRNEHYEDPTLDNGGSWPNAPDARGRGYQQEAKHYEDRASKFIASSGAPNRNLDRHFIFGGSGTDGIDGAALDDHLYGGGGDDRVSGMAGNDHLQGDGGDDVVIGGAGNDILFGGRGVDVLDGGLGDDTYHWNSGDGEDAIIDARETSGRKVGTILFRGQTLSGMKTQVAASDSRIFEDPALAGVRYTLTGKPGEEGILKIEKQGETGSLQIIGFKSEDFGIEIPPPASIAKTDELGTENNDSALASTASEQRVLGLGGNDRITVSHANSEGLGGLGSDFITNAVGDQKLYGDEGSDILVASDGADELYGGTDGDALQGGADDDYLQGDGGGDVLDGGLGDDVIYGGADNDFIVGGGTLTVEGWNADTPPSFGTITVGGVTGPSGIAGFVAIDDDGADFIDGGAGIDSIFAGSGNDFARGGTENDLVVGLAGDDVLEGNDGADALYGDGTQGQITIGGTPFYTLPEFHGSDVLWGGAGNDTLTGDGGADELYGEGDDDTLIGDATGLDEVYHSADYLDGGDGNDTLYGYGKDDTLFGGAGNDHLEGDSNTIAFATHGDDYLDGGAGNDHVQGDGGGDTLFGGDGIDQLFGDSDDTPVANQGDDYLDGGAGDDYLRGYGGADTLFGGDNADQLLGDAGEDYLDGEAGNDILSGGDGNDQLFGGLDIDDLQAGAGDDFLDGGDGNDVLFGGADNDELLGGAGVDQLAGGDGNDVLEGGLGNDTLFGEAGSDTYVYNLGDGQDAISNLDSATTSTDQLVFGAGITLGDIFITRGGTPTDLQMFMQDGGKVTVAGYFGALGNGSEIDEIRFDDDPGTILTVEAMRSMLVAGTAGADTLVGYETADTIDGLAGDDWIRGAEGDDTLSGSAGNDTIRGDTGDDTLDGGDGNDVMYGNAGSDIMRGGAGSDTLDGEEFNPPFEVAGNDTLDGGAGRDTLRGGRGNDTYVFDRGYGHDVVNEASNADGNDTLQLKAGVLPGDVTLYRHGDDLVVTIAGDEAEAWLTSYFTLADKPIEQIAFDNGTVWTAATIAANVVAGTQNAMTGTAGNDNFSVDHIGDTITEGAGQGTDSVQSWVSYTLPTNVENLTLTGNLDVNATGNALGNTLTGNSGDNRLTGGAGNDTLSGGLGDDTYVVTPASDTDTLIEAAGGGIDTVISDLNYTLSDHFENLTIQSNYIFNLFATGNALDNVIDARQRFGNQTTIDGGVGADTMIGDGQGATTYIVDNVGDVVMEVGSNSTNDVVRASVNYALQGGIEELELITGSSATNGTGDASNNTLVGNQNANTLAGEDGNDTLFGATGADTLIGGKGDDSYFLADVRVVVSGSPRWGLDSALSVNQDVVVEAAGEGVDTVRTLFDNYTLEANIENLVLMSSTTGPTVTVIQGTGNELNNQITGNSANNIIDGGGGADTMSGGLGNDTYYVDDAGDVVTENSGQGTDTVISQASYTLNSQVENLTLAGAAGISGTGNTLANRLDGSQNSAANVLAGGLGNDIYVVGDADIIVENAGEGIDTVESSVSYTLGANVETLVLTGSATTTGTGDALDNTLDGSQNSAANTLAGGLGNDTYIVDTVDLIAENSGEGIDSVTVAFSYTLAANVENLTLTGAAVAGTGSADDNVIVGNSLNNVLDGGAGADTLRGMHGDDTYRVDNAADVVDESGGSGFDTVEATASYSLGAGVENLFLLEGADNGTGNALDNTLQGNSAANILDGGAGADMLLGDAGDDIYRFGRGSGNDTIWDFDVTPGNIDTVEMAADVAPGDVSATRSGWDLVLTILGTTDSLRLSEFNSGTVLSGGSGGGYTEIERVVFTNGTVWDVEMLREVGVIRGTSGPDSLNGTSNEDVILGLGGNDTLNGFGGNDWLDGGAGNDSMTGGDGDDNYVVDSASDIVTESSSAGGIDRVTSSVSWTLGSNVEDLELAPGFAALNATGNTLDNILLGNEFANTLSGGTGADSMAGSLGDDTYVVDNLEDEVAEGTDEGIDTVQSSVSYTLSADVENLTLTGTSGLSGTGNTLANTLTGNTGANTLTGGAGNDTLNGGSGADTMIGGTGDDTYVRDNTGDVVTELADEGIDTVQSSVAYTLGNNLENLTLSGTSNIAGTGNSLDNILTGNTGTNTLTGGAGNDTYIVGTGDSTTELAAGGTDLVLSSVTWTLASNVENLTLTGTGTVNGTGNTQNNVITGNVANNILSGLTGADTLVGGLGNDTYVIDNAGDVVVENVGEGTDLVQSSITYTLGAGVEDLTLTGTSGLSGTGNELNNVLTGNSGANTLTGGAGNDTLNGGTGADTMIGGTGDDTYVRDNTGDVITELAGEGIDTVQTSLTYTLAANVENLTLTGTTALNGTGNTLNNVLTGNSGNNVLTGLGGDDTYFVTTGDTVTEAAGGGEDLVNVGATHTLATNVENLILTGTTAINGTGNGLNNLLRGNSAVNTLAGAAGNDILEGGGGNDILGDTGGANLLNGQAGTDTLNGNTGNELLIGGIGNDIINTNSGADIIAFNRGDGADTIAVSTVKDNSLSLGSGIAYADLYFQKSGTNLVLKTAGSAGTEQLTFTNWYSAAANRSVLNLQMVVEASADFDAGSPDALRNKKVARFNFDGLVGQFDAAIAADPGITSWALTNALTAFHLGGSDAEALGGDLAYRYGLQGNLAAVGSMGAQNVLAAAAFGSGVQAFQAQPALEAGLMRLS